MARRSGFLTWRRVLAAGVLLPVCVALFLAWFAGTGAALRWAAERAVAASTGRLTLEDVHGSLYGSVRIGRFAYQDRGRRIEGRELDLDWSPGALLFNRTVLVNSLTVKALSIDPGKTSAEPPSLPETLRLPLRVDIRSANIGTVEVATVEGNHNVRELGLTLEYLEDQYHAVATARTPWGTAAADLNLADRAPFALGGRAKLSREDEAHAYSVRATLAGSLADIHVGATATSSGATAELSAVLAPLERMPLKQATLHLADVDARKFSAGLPRTDIAAEMALRARGENALAGELKLANGLPGPVEASLLPLRAAQLSFEGVVEALELKQLRLDLGQAGHFTGAGGLRDGRLNLSLETSDLDLHRVYAKLAATKLRGKLELNAQTAVQQLQADLREGEHRVRLDASHRGDAVEVRSAQIFIAGGELSLSGEMSLARSRAFRAEGRLAHFDPSRLGDYPAALINGSISASGQLSPRAEAQLQFTTTDSRFRGHRLHGSGKARVSAERVWDSDVALELGANRLSAHGAFGAAGDGMDWRLDGIDLGAFAAQLGGQLRASGRLEGTIAEPSGTFRAKARNLAWAGKHRVSEFSAEGKIDKGIDGPLALSASLRDYRGTALRIDSASVTAAGRRGDHQLKLAVHNGTVDARAALSGGWRAGAGWSGRILSLDNGGRYAAHLEAPARLDVNGTDFSLGAATLRFARGNVRVDELARRANGVFSAGSVSGIDSGYLLGLLERPVDISSTVTLGGKWKLDVAEKINGELELQRERGDLSVRSEPVTALGLSRLALSATVVDDRLSAQLDAAGTVLGAVSGSVRTTLASQGVSLGLPGDAALSFDAQLDAPSLAWAAPLLGGKIVIDGSLKGKIAGQGTVAQPRLSGNITGDGLKLEYPEQGIYLENGSLRAKLQEDALVLEQFELHGGDGTIEGSGSLAWESGKVRARIALKANKLELVRRLNRHLVLSGNAEATLEDKRVRATAKLKADKGEIDLPAADTPTLSSDVVVLGRGDEAQKNRPPFATDIALELDLGEHFQLKGRGLDARLAGAVKVRATNGAPATASGSIRVAQGSYRAYGQSLAIDRGILNFSGPLDNPGLDIVALRKQLPVEAGVAIRGTALAPQISLVSNPSVPDSEKLSWLVLGRGMEGANRNDLALLQTAASALLARGESIPLQSRIAHAAGLDEFSLSGAGGLESTALTLGKRLSSRAYLTFEQGLATATNLVKINYTLTPRLSLRAQAGSDNALDAFYTFSFK